MRTIQQEKQNVQYKRRYDCGKERAQVALNSIGGAVLVIELMGRMTYTNLVA